MQTAVADRAAVYERVTQSSSGCLNTIQVLDALRKKGVPTGYLISWTHSFVYRYELVYPDELYIYTHTHAHTHKYTRTHTRHTYIRDLCEGGKEAVAYKPVAKKFNRLRNSCICCQVIVALLIK